MEVMARTEWQDRAARHRERLAPYVEPHLARQRAGEKHPVHDFLFGYYSYRPAQLMRWHPGFGVGLEDAADVYGDLSGYEVSADGMVTVTTALVDERRPLIAALDRLLQATASRPVHTGCFGLHEWAMVYRLDPSDIRHASWPLRLGSAGTDEVVESHRIACSHFDAYRFFTPEAERLNTLRPGRDNRPDFEQPGCLHAGMDLYKHAFRLSPLVSSDLVADAFELAWKIRELDMAASPYDFAHLGLEPVPIETPEGKRRYAAAQQDFAERGAPIRQRLIDVCRRLASSGTSGATR